MSDPTRDFLFGTRIPGAKFDNPGDFVEGQVTEPPQLKAQTEMGTGRPRTFDNGDPMMQLVVTLQTSLRDGPDDDGRRRVYVRGSKDPASRSLHAAVAGAVQAVNAPGIEVGGWLRVQREGTRRTDEGFTAYTFTAQYRRPDGSAFLAQATPQPQPPQQASVDPWASLPPTVTTTGVQPQVTYTPPPTPHPQMWQQPTTTATTSAQPPLAAEQQAAYSNLSPEAQAAIQGLYAKTPGNQAQPAEPPF